VYQIESHRGVMNKNEYVYPYFHQDWRLFASVPLKKIKAYIYLPTSRKVMAVQDLKLDKGWDETLKLGTYNSLFCVMQTPKENSISKTIARQWIEKLWKISKQFVPEKYTIAFEIINENGTCQFYLL
jgi:hypothetical protein